MSYERIIRDESTFGEGLVVVIWAIVFVWIFHQLTKSQNQHEPNVPVTDARLPEPSIQTIPSNENWTAAGTYKGSVLYERIYPSGKKAWRYLDESGQLQYPHRREVLA